MADSGRRASRIDLVGLCQRIGDVTALDEISLTIEAGEYFCLLGPPHSGKTTLLRLLAGADRPTAGQVLLDGVDLADGPYRGAVSAIFGACTLFPFLDVAANVAFGLRHTRGAAIRGAAALGRAGTSARVRSALAAVQMSEYARRRPPQLSAEQQQRVALARALVVRPRVVLLDDPLGSVDEQLRPALRDELRALQRQVGVTIVHATTDRADALAVSDRLALLRNGRIERIGTPHDVHQEPNAA